MWKSILMAISVILFMALTSCGDDVSSPSTHVDGGPIAWDVMSEDGDAKTSICYIHTEDDKIMSGSIYCGRKGGSVCLKNVLSKRLKIIPDTKLHPIEAYQFNDDNVVVAFKNEWCEVKVVEPFMYIDFKPYDAAFTKDIYIKAEDDFKEFNPRYLHIFRQ